MEGVYGQPLINCEEFIDMTEFDKIQLDIYKGIATARNLAQLGYLISRSLFDPNELSYKLEYNPLLVCYQEYLKLPDDDPVKIMGNTIEETYGHNGLSMFLKYVYRAHDLLGHYLLWDHYEGWRSNVEHRQLTEIAEHFPSLIKWLDSLVDQKVFANIGRAYLISVDSYGYFFEHRDPPLDPDVDEFTLCEFLHIRPDTKRPLYVYDTEIKKRYYVTSRVGFWNDRDLHGAEPIPEPTYALRVDGIFTDEFRTKLGKK